MKVLSSFPLQKLETLCDQKEVQANLLISPKNSTSQRKFIKAKKVKSLNKPIGQFLALAESTKKNLGTNSKKPKKLNAVKSQTVIKEMRKLDFFVKEESEKVQDIENGS